MVQAVRQGDSQEFSVRDLLLGLLEWLPGIAMILSPGIFTIPRLVAVQHTRGNGQPALAVAQEFPFPPEIFCKSPTDDSEDMLVWDWDTTSCGRKHPTRPTTPPGNPEFFEGEIIDDGWHIRPAPPKKIK